MYAFDKTRKAFTLIELLIVIAIIAILSIVVVLTLNPGEMLRQARDNNRLSDMDTLTHALSLYQTDKATQGGMLNLGNASTVYVSLPDATLSGNTTSTCASLGLPLLPAGYLYQCASPQSYRDSDGAGWIPINLASTTTGNPLSSLPADPTNTSSSRLYYAYVTNGSQYEFTSAIESQKYKLGGTNDVVSNDGGFLATVYEKGSKLGLEPLDYGDPALVGYWTFDEGSGGVAYDNSGSNATGTWSGAGTHWVAGKVGGAGQFATTTGDYVSVTSGWASLNSNFSIITWVYATYGANNIVFDGSGGRTSMGLIANNLGCLTNNDVWDSSGAVPLNQWTHLACVWDGTKMRGYVNGGVVFAVADNAPSANVTTMAISGNTGHGFIFSGLIDDVHVYSRALSASEVAALYNGGK